MGLTVGREEWVGLPDLGIPAIRAKVDTGAQTSSLHAFAIHRHDVKGRPRVRFGVHPLPETPDIELFCEADLVGEREITSSNGATELRFIIAAELEIAGRRWPIEISLTNRESMTYRMLLGRQALREVVVDVAEACRHGAPRPDAYAGLRHARHAERPLSIALLARNGSSATAMRLEETGRARGHGLVLLEIARCGLEMRGGAAQLLHDGAPVARPDAAIALLGGRASAASLGLLRHLESTGVRTLNGSVALAAAADPLQRLQSLLRRGLEMPAMGIAAAADAPAMLARLGGAPVYLRPLAGNRRGERVFAETETAAKEAIAAISGPVLLQHAGESIRLRRCLVIGRRVAAALGPPPGSPGRGGRRPRRGRPAKEERRLARRAARALGLQVAVVDLLSGPSGPLVLDADPLGDIAKFENAAGLDAAAMIFEQLERRAGRVGKGSERPAGTKLS